MKILGLTGSIGMGKSTTAAMFRDEGVPVWDADAAVHDLYRRGGAAVGPVEAAFPGVAVRDEIDRRALSAKIQGDPEALARLEAVVHPLVAAHRSALLDDARKRGAAVVVLDVPLLFETGAAALCDAVVVVTAPAAVQRERVLTRPGMDAAKFAALLERQTPDAEKRARADWVVDTSKGLDAARAEVQAILSQIRHTGRP